MGIKISHNKKLFWIIVILIIILIGLVYVIVKNKNQEINEIGKTINEECKIDNECVPESCCHPESCVSKDKSTDCSNIFCSQVCLGPLDCGAGNCGCVKGKCEVINN